MMLKTEINGVLVPVDVNVEEIYNDAAYTFYSDVIQEMADKVLHELDPNYDLACESYEFADSFFGTVVGENGIYKVNDTSLFIKDLVNGNLYTRMCEFFEENAPKQQYYKFSVTLSYYKDFYIKAKNIDDAMDSFDGMTDYDICELVELDDPDDIVLDNYDSCGVSEDETYAPIYNG